MTKVKGKLSLSNYATKTDLKNVTSVDTSKFAKKVGLGNLKSNVDELDIGKLKSLPTNLSNLKSKVDNLDIDKLVSVTVNLSKLSDVVKNDVVKKDLCNAKIKNIEYKVPNITKVATNATHNAKKMKLKVKYLILTQMLTLILILTLK